MNAIDVKQRSRPMPSTPSEASTARPKPIVTWAEQAECTCPDSCDRDHEQD